MPEEEDGEVVRLEELILRLGLALGLSEGGILARLALDRRELIGIAPPPDPPPELPPPEEEDAWPWPDVEVDSLDWAWRSSMTERGAQHLRTRSEVMAVRLNSWAKYTMLRLRRSTCRMGS